MQLQSAANIHFVRGEMDTESFYSLHAVRHELSKDTKASFFVSFALKSFLKT